MATVMGRLDTGGDGWVGLEEFLRWWDLGLSMEALTDERVAAEVVEMRERAEDALHAQVQPSPDMP